MQQQRGLVVIPVSIQREASQPAGLSREQRLEMHRGMQALAFSWQDMVDQFKKHVPGRTAPPSTSVAPANDDLHDIRVKIDELDELLKQAMQAVMAMLQPGEPQPPVSVPAPVKTVASSGQRVVCVLR
jgi:hypothetical protein